MNYYGMDTEQVQSTGRRVYDLQPEASAAVNAVLESYTDASGVVHHHLVSQALSTYRDTHQKSHLALPEAVRGLGSNTSSGGRAIADGNNEAASEQGSSLATQQALSREINTKL